jgi:hypothetical protein
MKIAVSYSIKKNKIKNKISYYFCPELQIIMIEMCKYMNFTKIVTTQKVDFFFRYYIVEDLISGEEKQIIAFVFIAKARNCVYEGI